MSELSDQVRSELSQGGEWLGAARNWMQHNIKDGDRINWSSTQPVSVAFCDLEAFAKAVAIAAVTADRQKR